MYDNLNLYSISGIGDIYWSLIKILPNLSKERNININVYKRIPFSAIFLKDLKRINEIKEFSPSIFKNDYNRFLKHCDYMHEKIYKNVLDENRLNSIENIWLHPNIHINEGNRIENFLPKLKNIQYKLEWNFDQDNYNRAIDITKNKKTVVIYTSSLNNNTIFGSDILGKWSSHNWVYLLKKIKDTYENVNIIWIGASYDHTINIRFMNEKDFDKYIDHFFIDEPATFILPLLRSCNCFISYQSGISVLSVYENVPTCMLYFNFLNKIIGSWEPFDCLEDKKLYNPLFFNDICENDKLIINWIGKHI